MSKWFLGAGLWSFLLLPLMLWGISAYQPFVVTFPSHSRTPEYLSYCDMTFGASRINLRWLAYYELDDTNNMPTLKIEKADFIENGWTSIRLLWPPIFRTRWSINLAMWFWLMLATLPLIARKLFCLKPSESGACKNCGHQLIPENNARCPECGTINASNTLIRS